MLKITQLIFKYKEMMLYRDSMLDIFTDTSLDTKEEVELRKLAHVGKLYTDDGKVYVISGVGDTWETEEVDVKKGSTPLLNTTDKVILKPGVLKNHNDKPITTTYGRLILNYCALSSVFGDVIPYVNTAPWNIKKLSKSVAKAAIDGKVDTKQINKFVDRLYFIVSYSDFSVPSLTAKAITVDKSVSKRREELIANKDKITDPDEMIRIENELIELDRASLKDDESADFLIENKNYDVHRKRMFLGIGMLNTFGDEDAGFTFSGTNLDEGWSQEEFADLSNDIRRGSSSRAKETAKGGAESKFLGRTFQDSKIVEDDCKTKRGLKLLVTADNKGTLAYRNIIVNGKVVSLTDADVDKYIGKTVILRSPMYCASTSGYCYTCMDTRFEKLNVKHLNLLPVNIGSAILTNSMKAMHGTKMSTLKFDNINEFLI